MYDLIYIYVIVKTTGLLLCNLHYKYDNFWVTKIKYMVCNVQDDDVLYNIADDQSIYERLPFYSHRKQLHDRHNFIKRWRGWALNIKPVTFYLSAVPSER